MGKMVNNNNNFLKHICCSLWPINLETDTNKNTSNMYQNEYLANMHSHICCYLLGCTVKCKGWCIDNSERRAAVTHSNKNKLYIGNSTTILT